ncbi:MAG: MFS transporter [Pseudonocardiaceae bacterium]
MSFIGYPIGSALSVPIIERIERKYLIIVTAVGMAMFGLAFGYAESTTTILVFGFLYTAISNVFSNAVHVYQAEIFPTKVRSTAATWTYSLSRLSTAAMAFLLVPLLRSAGPAALFTNGRHRHGRGRPRRRVARPAQHRPGARAGQPGDHQEQLIPLPGNGERSHPIHGWGRLLLGEHGSPTTQLGGTLCGESSFVLWRPRPWSAGLFSLGPAWPLLTREIRPAVPAQTNQPANPVILTLRRSASSLRAAANFSRSDATLTNGPART